MDNLNYIIIYMLLVAGASGNPLIPTTKLSIATWESYHHQDHKGPGTYAFGYDIEDPVTGNVQFKQEERHANGTVTGNYGYVDADGKPLVVTYIADEMGYRAKIEKEGEPVQYLPDVISFFGNSLQRRKQPHFSVDHQYLGSEDSYVQSKSYNHPSFYRLEFPFYYK